MGMFNDLHEQDIKETTTRRTSLRASAKRPPAHPAATSPTRRPHIELPPSTQASADQPPATTPIQKAQAVTNDGSTLPGLGPPTGDTLDMSQSRHRKFTCMLTPAEARALDLLKIEVSDRFEATITKESLARCAIHYMIEDYKKQGDVSPILDPLRDKAGSR